MKRIVFHFITHFAVLGPESRLPLKHLHLKNPTQADTDLIGEKYIINIFMNIINIFSSIPCKKDLVQIDTLTNFINIFKPFRFTSIEKLRTTNFSVTYFSVHFDLFP